VCRSNIALLVVAVALSAQAGPDGASVGPSGIAEREIARRMARMEDARQAVEKGDKLFSEEDYEGALNQYKAAIEWIPVAPASADWRSLTLTKYADACVALANDRAKTGRYRDARELIQEALDTHPGHRGAETLLKRLDDADRFPPALSPEHVKKVQDVEHSLQKASSLQDLGEYDNAIKEFQEALRGDPYNTAARRGMERVEQRKGQYQQSARDHRRAAMISHVDSMWEDQVPVKTIPVVQETGEVSKNGGMALFQKMKSINFPTVVFNGATIEEAVEYLRVKSRDLDQTTPDPSQRGVNIILKAGDTPSTAQISLDLKDVLMEEALRYITELAGMKYKVEPFAVLVVPVTESTTEMLTRVYKVPPDFLTISNSAGDAAAPAAPADPFAKGAGGDAGGPKLLAKQSAKDILTASGVPFPDGASAVYNPVTSQLVVRNTAPNIDMVETYIESIANRTPKQVYITTKFVEVTQKNTEELGFDWLLGPFNLPGTNRTFGSGGTFGNSANGVTTDYPGGVGGSPVSGGLRFGNAAISPDSIDGLLTANKSTTSVSSGIFSVSGVLTDPQFQVVVRALSQKKGVDLMSAPSVTTKSGVKAKVEVIREFLYPTEFDPPQIPQNFSGQSGGGLTAASDGSFPVTPTTPTAFQTKNIGVSMEVDPTVGPDGYTIDLVMSPEVIEFEGFINYGSPITTTSTDALGNPSTITLTENRIPQPVFTTRRVNTSVTVWDGQTVALGGLIREDAQSVQDKVPLLGDLPLIGRLFQTKSEDHFKRNLMVFVTARLMDPSGQPVRQQNAPAAVEESTLSQIQPAALGGGLLPAPVPAANP